MGSSSNLEAQACLPCGLTCLIQRSRLKKLTPQKGQIAEGSRCQASRRTPCLAARCCPSFERLGKSAPQSKQSHSASSIGFTAAGGGCDFAAAAAFFQKSPDQTAPLIWPCRSQLHPSTNIDRRVRHVAELRNTNMFETGQSSNQRRNPALITCEHGKNGRLNRRN